MTAQKCHCKSILWDSPLSFISKDRLMTVSFLFAVFLSPATGMIWHCQLMIALVKQSFGLTKICNGPLEFCLSKLPQWLSDEIILCKFLRHN